jgi:hypothetical protein
MTTRYEYRFETVPHKHGGHAYQDAIIAAAAEGWRLVQVLVEVPAAIPDAHVVIYERALD